MQQPEILSTDVIPQFGEAWGEIAIGRVREYMDYLYESVDADPMGEETVTLTGLPFCGCSTCDEREFAYALVLETMTGARGGEVELVSRG